MTYHCLHFCPLRKQLIDLTVILFWPGLTMAIHEFCKSCQICQNMAKNGLTPKAYVQQGFFFTCTPFERVSDIIGHLPVTSKHENRYILTLIDFATRWPEWYL